ncbi:MAG TPA: peptide ABC transporter substrate-binding protein [Candidatus Pullichristensenella excrementigallinarum]|uniref:Peptide ABC transporter substrate-binding protein n=1 Tax=Candidatus Pullichristensenella excrementigallinarum TaxID=2840907 RepID=A0A9D1IBH1_9FIRM|nr:peptide ABC transporter substrate-binding protein [Candidatus Pullichristensenella excrementigallinarum]
MKRTTRLLALLVALIIAFPMAAFAEGETAVYRTLYASEVDTLNYLYTTTTNNLEIPANTIDTLIEYDCYGVLQPSLAESWEHNEDYTEWTFHIREGVKWVDKDGNEVADVTAHDWVSAAHYILDAHNDSSNEYNWEVAKVTNAAEYYAYTAYQLALENATDGTDENGNAVKLDEDGEVIEEVAAVAAEDIGVKAVDDYTLVFTLDAPCSYFLSMLCWSAFMPVNGDFLAECGTSFGTSAETLLYCGAFILSEFEPQVQRVMTKNASYWDAENVFIDTIQMTYNAEASTIAPTMYLQGEVDYAEVGANLLDAMLSSYSDQIHASRPDVSYSYWYLFNFDPNFDAEYEPDNWKIAVNNENFRLSIMHGLDRVNAMQVYDAANPEGLLNNTITPLSFASASKDYAYYGGLDKYTDGETFNADLALEYKEKAMEELSAEGCTFPVKVYMRYNPTTTNWAEECLLVEQQLENLLGADYIDVIVEAGPETSFLAAVRRTGDYGLMKCNWGADYSDASAFIVDPFGEDSSYSFIFKSEDEQTQAYYQEYLDLVAEALTITDDDEARYETFAKAEAVLLDHGFAIPIHTNDRTYAFAKVNPFEGPYAAFGFSSLRYKGQHVLETSMGMEEFEAAYQTWLTEREAALEAASN